MNKRRLSTSLLYISLWIGLMFLSSCYRTSEKIDPKIDYAIQDKYLLNLPSPFPSLSEQELSQDWSKEYRIGIAFAHQLDLYQAITSFKRAEILLPQDDQSRKVEIEYEIFLCYYLGRKYSDAIATYEQTDLHLVTTDFAACEDLLILLYDCYNRMGDEVKAERIFSFIKQHYPQTAEKLYVYTMCKEGNIGMLHTIASYPTYEYIEPMLDHYETQKKSITTAKGLNALMPGAGYLYLGQKQSALTAFLLNGLFIGASCFFF